MFPGLAEGVRVRLPSEIHYTGLSPGAGDLFFFGRLRRLLRGSETERNAKGTPSQGAFGAEGLGRLFVCMNPRAHEALFRDAERHAAPSEHGGLWFVQGGSAAGEGAWRAWRRCAAWEQCGPLIGKGAGARERARE